MPRIGTRRQDPIALQNRREAESSRNAANLRVLNFVSCGAIRNVDLFLAEHTLALTRSVPICMGSDCHAHPSRRVNTG